MTRIQLTPGNSNLQRTKENSLTQRIFGFSETPIKANSDKNEILVRVKANFFLSQYYKVKDWANLNKLIGSFFQ